MSDPHAASSNATTTASDKPKGSKKAGGPPAAEGSAPSAVLTSTDGAPVSPEANQQAGGEVAPPLDARAEPGLPPEVRVDDQEPPSERGPRRFERRDPPRFDEELRIPDAALDALVRGLEARGYELTKKAPSTEKAPNPGGHVEDEDVPFLASALTDAQVQELLAIRANGADIEKWRARGAIPGMHWIPTSRAHCTINGVTGQMLEPGKPVPMAWLDKATTEQFLEEGVIHAPGQQPRVPRSARRA